MICESAHLGTICLLLDDHKSQLSFIARPCVYQCCSTAALGLGASDQYSAIAFQMKDCDKLLQRQNSVCRKTKSSLVVLSLEMLLKPWGSIALASSH